MPERADDSPRWIAQRLVKAALAGALHAAGAHRLVGRARRWQAGGRRVLVVSYHRTTPDFAATAREGLASLLVSTATLRTQLEQLGRAREIVSLADARRILAAPPPRHGAQRTDVAAVTFDDGYADVHGVALPILAALRVPASIFVPTGYLGTLRRMAHDRLFASLSALARRGIPPARAGLDPELQTLLDACARPGPAATLDRLIARLAHPRLLAVTAALEARAGVREEDLPAGTRLLSWEELRALDSAGLDVGGHSVSHAVLTNLPLTEARREVEGCRDALAEHLGKRPRHFAYPNGYHGPAIRRLVADAGFEAGLTTEDEENVRGGDPYRLRRKVLWENTTRGPRGYSAALATCNLEGVFSALGLARPVSGARRDVSTVRPARAPVSDGRAGERAEG